MSLLDDILSGGFDLLDRNDGAIAAALSVGRTRIVPTEIGKGRILETLGLDAGNALLDVIDGAPEFRHVKHLVANGWLDIGSPIVRAAVDGLVPSVLTQAQADALKSLAVVADPVSAQQVAAALEGL